ncbi:MAG: mechanosensitive ion channel [Firmicutes bacterium]|nr:mechanosensitive ion channel [Bacillota bacterium]
MNNLQNIWEQMINSIPAVIYAVLLLLLALIVASVAKSIVVKILKKIKAERLTDKLGIKDETTGSSLEFIGKLVFIIIFLLFLPGVLDNLGMQNVSQPISTLVSQFLNYVPNILAAIIILVVGVFAANIIRQLVLPILQKANIDKLQEKAGITQEQGATISSVLSYLIYVLILIPVIIAALQVLNITAISDPAIGMLNRIIIFLPNIFVALAILILGVFIAKLAGNLLVSILSSVGADKVTGKLITTDAESVKNFSLSKAIGGLVKYIIILLFLVEAINVLKLDVLRQVGDGIISYLPYAISGIIIMGGAIFLGNWAESLIIKKFPNAKGYALGAKWLIVALAVFMTLNQLGIATSIVNAAFIIVLGAFAVAFAVAFGIGGKKFAGNLLAKLEESMENKDKKQDK